MTEPHKILAINCIAYMSILHLASAQLADTLPYPLDAKLTQIYIKDTPRTDILSK
jgi:hypothetical protein